MEIYDSFEYRIVPRQNSILVFVGDWGDCVDSVRKWFSLKVLDLVTRNRIQDEKWKKFPFCVPCIGQSRLDTYSCRDDLIWEGGSFGELQKRIPSCLRVRRPAQRVPQCVILLLTPLGSKGTHDDFQPRAENRVDRNVYCVFCEGRDGIQREAQSPSWMPIG